MSKAKQVDETTRLYIRHFRRDLHDRLHALKAARKPLVSREVTETLEGLLNAAVEIGLVELENEVAAAKGAA